MRKFCSLLRCPVQSSTRPRNGSPYPRAFVAPRRSRSAPRGLCRQPEPLPGQQLPAAVLLLPDLKGTDLGGSRLALEFGFGQVDLARDGGIADHCHLELGEGERLDDLLAGHHPVDELLLGLDPSVRMAVADLRGRHLLQLDLVGFERRLSQDLDALGDRRLVGGFGAREATEQEAGSAESKCACNREVTTRHVHWFPPRQVWSTPGSPKPTSVRLPCRRAIIDRGS